MGINCSECLAVQQCDIRAANAEYWANQAATAPERLEQAEIEARLRYAETEEILLQGGHITGFDDGELLDFQGQLLDDVEKRSQDAQLNAADERARWQERQQEYLAQRDAAIEKCGPLACIAAGITRKLRIDRYACGSTNKGAQAMIRNLSAGKTKLATPCTDNS